MPWPLGLYQAQVVDNLTSVLKVPCSIPDMKAVSDNLAAVNL